MILLFLKGTCQGRQAPSLQTVLNSITYGNGCYRDPSGVNKKAYGLDVKNSLIMHQL